MSQANPMLHAILVQPEDDALRLICADWLEEHGDADRAQFIRAQCELARLPAWDRRREELTWLAEGLRARHGGRWRAELPVLEGLQWGEFERGFVSTVRVGDVQTLYRHDKAIAAAAPVYRAVLPHLNESSVPRPAGAAPWLRAVRFTGYQDFHLRTGSTVLQGVTELELLHFPQHGNLDWLIRHSGQTALTSLKIEGDHTVGRGFARALAGCVWARRLTRLELGTRFIDYDTGYFEDPTLGEEGLIALAGSPHLSGLTALNLTRQCIQTAGLNEVLSSPNWSGLQQLYLRSNQIGNVAAFNLSAGAEILCLDLGDNQIGDIGAVALAAAPRLAALASLGLDTSEITVHGVQALASAFFWPSLQRLDLSRNPLGEQGLRALAQAEPPGQLYALNLCDCDLDNGGQALAAIPWLTSLQCLDLSRNLLDEHSVAALARLTEGSLRSLSVARTGLVREAVGQLAPLWPKLVLLDLNYNIVSTGLEALIRTGPARQLQTLRLRNCHISRQEVLALLLGDTCPSLHTLVLAGNSPDPSTLHSLIASPLAGQLLDLDLSGCSLTNEAAYLLAQAPALAGLDRLNLRNNNFDEQALVALAQSPYLASVNKVLLSGNPWRFEQASRQLLAKRFGPYWYGEEDEDQQDEDDEASGGC
jgi:uncharacterized protein (TIGR02996 family)